MQSISIKNMEWEMYYFNRKKLDYRQINSFLGEKKQQQNTKKGRTKNDIPNIKTTIWANAYISGRMLWNKSSRIGICKPNQFASDYPVF